METPTLLNYRETARYLNVSVRSIQRWAASGKLPTVRFSKRTIKIPLDKLSFLINSGSITAYTEKEV